MPAPTSRLARSRSTCTRATRSTRPAGGTTPARPSFVQSDELALHAAQLERLACQVALGAGEQLLDLAVLAGDARQREPRPLPELVMVDLRDRGPEAPLELGLHGQELLALALERVVLGEVQLDGEDADPAGAQGATRRWSEPSAPCRGRCARPHASRRSRARRLP